MNDRSSYVEMTEVNKQGKIFWIYSVTAEKCTVTRTGTSQPSMYTILRLLCNDKTHFFKKHHLFLLKNGWFLVEKVESYGNENFACRHLAINNYAFLQYTGNNLSSTQLPSKYVLIIFST